ncbi:hypothetical protein [Microtetraspora fusca]|uniref:FxLD family lantipeptide n=1 Tax=Microtetraspora fusca TaxID=1997 RepID=A0ABW6VND4_MICFU|nr:hypothetical protein [Microtetraspora fusca]
MTEHLADCWAEECDDCGAAPGQRCAPDCFSYQLETHTSSGVETPFGVISDADPGL